MTSSPGTVEVEIITRLVWPDAESIPVRTTLLYTVADPLAVHMTFHATDGVVTWSFARDLLIGGLDEATGIADVRVWPWNSHPRDDLLMLGFSSPDGDAVFETARVPVARFLRRTLALVPRGSEGNLIDIDKVIKDLINWETT